jgi:hypothetical protein
MMYKQCKLSFENANTVGWIEDRGAKLGARVEMEDGNFWTVNEVFDHTMSRETLREKQRMDRGSLLSVKPIKA